MEADHFTTQKISAEGSVFVIEFDRNTSLPLSPNSKSNGGRRRVCSTGGGPFGVVVALFLALALLLEQYFHAGTMRPVFAIPGYLLLAGVCLLSALKVAFSKRRPSLPVMLLVLTVAGGGWLAWRFADAASPWEGMILTRLVCAAIATYLVTSLVLTRLRWRLLFLALLLLGALVQGWVGIAQFQGEGPGWSQLWYSEQLRQWYGEGLSTRARGFYLNPNHLSWLLSAATLMALAFTLIGRVGPATRLACLLAVGVAGAGVLLTGSRGGALALAVGLMVYLVLGVRAMVMCRHRRRWLLRGVFVLLLAALAGSAFWLVGEEEGIRKRLEGSLSDSYRRDLWPLAWEQVRADPWQGGGAGSFRYRAREARPAWWRHDDLYVHNDWLQAAAEYGLPVLGWLLLVVALHGAVAVSGYLEVLDRLNARRWPGSNQAALLLGGGAVLAAWSFHTCFDFNLQVPANTLLAAALMGMLVSRRAGGEEAAVAGWVWRGGVATVLLGVGIALLSLCATGRGEWHQLQGENALLKGEPRTARLEAARGLVFAPGNPYLWRTQGEAWLALGKEERLVAHYERAEEAFARLVELAPRDDLHYLRLAEAQLGQGKGREALQSARQAMALAPGYPAAYEIAGRSAQAQGDDRQAQEYYHEALARGAPASVRERLRQVTQKLRLAGQQ